ncbi:MAG: cobyric acid synthase, partial [Reyranella sp.]
SIKAGLLDSVLDSFGRLAEEADLVLVEGAGSASEVNLRADDIANMGFARAAGVPVVLVGDIDRGGVIASLVGTRAVIDPEDAAMIEGFIVNRFRGDASLFTDGMTLIAERTGWPALGLVPYFPEAVRLPAEDALSLPVSMAPGGIVKIVVLAYPHLANFDDVDPLRQEPDVDVVFVQPGQPIPGDATLVVLPGSKATIADLGALREAGWDIDLKAHLRRGGHVLGLCGGYQMLGRRVADPDGIEGPPCSVEGLGLLDAETVLGGDKVLIEVTGKTKDEGVPFKGYEMHVGRTITSARPLLELDGGGTDGAIDASGRVAGCYIHGLLADDRQRRHWLQRIGAASSGFDYEAGIEDTLDRLADHLEEHVDCARLLDIARAPRIGATK